MLEVDIDDSGTVDFFEFLCVARLISQGKGTSGAFIVPKLGTKFLYFFYRKYYFNLYPYLFVFQGKQLFSRRRLWQLCKNRILGPKSVLCNKSAVYSVSILHLLNTKSLISSNDETLLIVASYRGAQGKMRMFSLEIRGTGKGRFQSCLAHLDLDPRRARVRESINNALSRKMKWHVWPVKTHL